MNKIKIPTIIGLLIIVFGIGLAIFGLSRQQNTSSKASSEISPQNVQIVAATENSLTITWTTDKKVEGFVKWGETTSVPNSAFSDPQEAQTIHTVSIGDLKANTQYFYTIVSEGKEFKEGSNPWIAKTRLSESDFTNSNAQVELPNEQKDSRFIVEDPSKVVGSKKVSLDSIKEGEVVTSTKPQFFGTAEKGTKITVKVESENPQTTNLTVGSTGSWKWSPPTSLTEGVHKITISWTDENGVLQTLTKNFIVQAADNPAFVSTPSATPTLAPTIKPTASPSLKPSPTATASASIKPTATASASATIKPTASPKPTAKPTATQSASLPDSGSTEITIILFIAGIAFLVSSAVAWNSTNKNE